MKTILCFGDSNTWGKRPDDGSRYERHQRWTGILHQELGETYQVIEEGLCGRTSVWDDPLGEFRNGKASLGVCLETHRPLDLVVIMLGTNETKRHFSLEPPDIARGAGLLVQMVKRSQAGRDGAAPCVLLVAPPPLGEVPETNDQFRGGREKSLEFARLYRAVAAQEGCAFFDAGSVVRTSDVDGVHWAPEEHAKFARALAPVIRELIG